MDQPQLIYNLFPPVLLPGGGCSTALHIHVLSIFASCFLALYPGFGLLRLLFLPQKEEVSIRTFSFNNTTTCPLLPSINYPKL